MTNKIRGLRSILIVQIDETDFPVHTVILHTVTYIGTPDCRTRVFFNGCNTAEIDAPGVPDPDNLVVHNGNIDGPIIAENTPVVPVSADVMDIITGQRDILVDGPGIDGATVHQIAGKTIRTVHFVIPHETRAGWGNRFAVIGSYPDSPIGKITEEVIPDVKVTSPGDDGEILHHQQSDILESVAGNNGFRRKVVDDDAAFPDMGHLIFQEMEA